MGHSTWLILDRGQTTTTLKRFSKDIFIRIENETMKTNQEAHNQHEILSEEYEKIGKWIYIGIIWMMIILIIAIILVTVVFFGKSSNKVLNFN